MGLHELLHAQGMIFGYSWYLSLGCDIRNGGRSASCTCRPLVKVASHTMVAQERSPSAVAHVYKTTVPPLMKDCHAADGTFEAAFMGKRAHVVALNAVSRHLAGVQVHTHRSHQISHSSGTSISVALQQMLHRQTARACYRCEGRLHGPFAMWALACDHSKPTHYP